MSKQISTALFSLLNIPAGQSFEGQVQKVEEVLCKEPQALCPVVHHFGPGIYVREVTMKAGTFAIGHKQKYSHLNIFLQGAVEIIKEDGSKQVLKAPMIFTSPPGRKVGLILEDTVWLNIYNTEEIDIEKLEKHFLDKTESTVYKASDTLQAKEAREDFLTMLQDLEVDEETVRKQSEETNDLIPFPSNCSLSVQLGPSSIEGTGLFASSIFHAGDFIAIAKIGSLRTPAGRYTNHSGAPNAQMVRVNDNIYLQALTEIMGCKGGQLGDEILVDYRQCNKIVKG